LTSALNSEPSSMLIARTGKGIRSARRSSIAAAATAVAGRPSSSVSRRETTSRGVTCFQILLQRTGNVCHLGNCPPSRLPERLSTHRRIGAPTHRFAGVGKISLFTTTRPG
jgi:hypothetical protein